MRRLTRCASADNRSVLALVLSSIALAGCGGSSPTGTPTMPVATVAVVPATAALVVNQTVQLVASPKDSAGGALSDRTVTWTATPAGVVTVSNSGLVTAVATGTVTATATSEGKSGTATITVGEGGVVGVAGGTVSTTNGNAQVILPAGAVSSTTTITITPVTNVSGVTNLIPGTVYDFGPTGTQFAQPAVLKVKYDPSNLPGGASPALLQLFVLNGTRWQVVPGSTVDVNTHIVTGSTPHFSVYGVCQLQCYANSTSLQIVFDALPAFVNQGGTAQATGRLYRNGDYAGPIAITVDGVPSNVTATVAQSPVDFLGIILTLRATTAAVPGRYDLTIRASATAGGNGVDDFAGLAGIVVVASAYTFTAPLGVSAMQGLSGSATLTFARGGGFAAPITMSAENLPNGVTASFSPNPVTASTSTVTFNVGAGVPAGDYNIKLRGVAAGQPDATAVIDLTVTASTASGFTIVGTPPNLSVPRSTSASTGLKLARTGGFVGTPAFTVSGLPAGLSATVTPTSVADSFAVTVTASSSTANGLYPITVTATSGSTVRTATITVSVGSVGSSGIHLDYSLCGPAKKPIWVAYQDGSNAFVQAIGNGDVYDFTLTSPEDAVAVVTQQGSNYATVVYFGTQAELGTLGGCATPGGSKTMTGTVAPLAVGEFAGIVFGGVRGATGGDGTANDEIYSLTGVASGNQDLVAFRYRNSGIPGFADKGIVRRDLDIPNGGSLARLDFGTAEAFAPATATVNLSGGGSFIYVGYSTACSNDFAPLYSGTFTGSSTLFAGVPSGVQRAGDLHQLVVGTAQNGPATVRLFHTMADQTVTLGAALPGPSVSTLSGTVKRLGATLTVPSDYLHVGLRFGSANTVQLGYSMSYFASRAATLTTPDFGTVPGYITSWAPPAGATNWSVSATSYLPWVAPCSDGFTGKTANATGSN